MNRSEQKARERLAGNVREMLARTGKSQQDLADAVGVSQVMVSRWANGKNTPDAFQLLAMAQVFGLPVGFLLERDMIGVTDRDLARIQALEEMVEVIGVDEAHRRLLVAPSQTQNAQEAKPSGLAPVGDHTVLQGMSLDDIKRQTRRNKGRGSDSNQQGSAASGRP